MTHVCLLDKIDQLQVDHSLVVVPSLITPVILKQHCLVLDFTSTPISVTLQSAQLKEACQAPDLQPIWKAAQKMQVKACAVASTMEMTDEILT